MTCDKCGGLVVKVAEDELKCCMCSKRFWKVMAAGKFDNELTVEHPLDKAVRLAPALPDAATVSEYARRRCKAQVNNGGQCRTSAIFRKPYCRRHDNSSVTQSVVEHTEEKYIAMAKVPTANPINCKTLLVGPTPQSHGATVLDNHFMPDELRFSVSRNAKDWGRFALSWSLKFTDYEIDRVYEVKESEKLDVFLRLRKKADE